MKTQRFNWQIWAGFLLSFAASLSYPTIFVNWPITRDFPWVTLLLYLVAGVLLYVGIRRAFESGRSRKAKVAASILAGLSVVIIGVFLYFTFVIARQLPPSQAAPRVGQSAPAFTLADSSGKLTSLSELLSSPIGSQTASVKPKGVLLIFYRGYW